MLTEAHRAFSHDIRAAILVFQTSRVGIELFSFVNGFFCPNEFALDFGHVSENTR